MIFLTNNLISFSVYVRIRKIRTENSEFATDRMVDNERD